jgi:hypothetical protein
MIAACYTVFNGEELLEKSMQQMADVVDFFVICYQETSNKGEKNPGLGAKLRALSLKFNCIFAEFKPVLSENTKENERNKHQLMLQYARSKGATHVILAACDHFYRTNELKRAVATSVLSGFDVTFTAMFTYYKRPTWQLFPKEEYFMPLVIKLHPETAIVQTRTYPVLVDPSVKVNTCKKWWVFPIQECALHHYSMVRDDINSKFKNAAASIRWKPEQVERFLHEYDRAAVGDSISYFQGRKIVEVENYFLL